MSDINTTKEPEGAQPLPRELSSRDLAAWLILIVLFYLSVSVVQSADTAAFFYWLMGLCFLIPISSVMCWLAHRLSFHGGHYVWIRKMGGLRWGELTGAFTCLYGVCVILTTLQGVLILIHGILPQWFNDPFSSYFGEICLLLFTTALALIPLRLLKHLLFGSAVLYVCIFLVVGLTGVYWLLQGHIPAIDVYKWHMWQPNGQNIGVYSIVMWAFMGTDWPFIMGNEVRGEEGTRYKASRFVWWGNAWLLIAYLAATFGVMVVLPQGQAESLDSMFLTISASFGPLASIAVLVALGISQIAISVAVLLVCSRMFMTMAYDRLLPKRFARIYWGRVPVISILTQASISGIVFLCIGIVMYSQGGAISWLSPLGVRINIALQALAAMIWSMATILLYSLVIYTLTTRRARARTEIERQGGLQRASIVRTFAFSVMGILATLAGGILILFSSWVPAIIPTNEWTFIIAFSTMIVLVLGWLCAEVPRQWRLTWDLKQVTSREQALIRQLRRIYSEQSALVERQQKLLQQRDTLYREQMHLAITDSLTNLPNQRALEKALDTTLPICDARGETCALLFVDIDHFKRINDARGHRAGDALLCEIGARLQRAVGDAGIVGRYGGEEFIIIRQGLSLCEAKNFAEQLREMIQCQPYEWKPDEQSPALQLHITASIGVVLYPLHATRRANLLRAADRAMYQAKARGRNCVSVAQLDENAPDDTRVTSGILSPTETTTLKALLALLEEKDLSTYRHGQRVAALAEETARTMGLCKEEIFVIHLAAMVHDIGKPGAHKSYIQRMAPLTIQEWNEIKENSLVGQKILSQAGGIFSIVARAIEALYERWDGHGYPAGLRHDNIPLTARIIAVVDTYDAMTAPGAYSPEEAYAQLLIGSGTRFDPEVIRAFAQVLCASQRTTDAALPIIDIATRQQEEVE